MDADHTKCHQDLRQRGCNFGLPLRALLNPRQARKKAGDAPLPKLGDGTADEDR